MKLASAARILLLAAGGSLAALSSRAQTELLTDDDFTKIAFEQKLDSAVDPDLQFLDEDGKQIRLGDYFGKKPIVLLLGYYRCPMLCTLTLNGLVDAMEDMKWSVGKEFEIIDVSIDPNETPVLALAKKHTYLKQYGRSGAESGWHFLTGGTNSIHQLAGEVGYHYAYDPLSKEYAHPSGVVVLTPAGHVSHYLFGVTFAARDLLPALQDAASRRVGSPIEQFVLLCFHYNPIKGKYGAAIMLAVRIGGITTLFALVGGVVFAMWREKRKARGAQEKQATNPSPAVRA